MGCGCAKRGKALRAMARDVGRGNVTHAKAKLAYVGRSAAKDVRLTLAHLKHKARRNASPR